MSRPHRAASEPAAPRAQRRGGPTRREFGGLTVAAAAYWLPGCAAPPPASRKRPSRLRVGVIGLRVQGQRDLIDCVRHPRVDVRAVCDVDMELAVQAGRAVQRAGAAPAVHQDLRRLLDDPSLDAVVVATPDHWHALAALWACRAGKHVYLASPASHSPAETRWMAATAQRHSRVIQVAMPSRCHPAVLEAIEHAPQALGRILWARAICYLFRPSIGRLASPAFVPPSVDYDLWLGPARERPLARRSLHGDWRFDWETGNGEIGASGAHLLDVARRVLRADGPPTRVWVAGGRLGFDDDGATPNTMLACLQFDNASPLLFEQRNLPIDLDAGRRMDRSHGLDFGVVVQGTEARLLVDLRRRTAMLVDERGEAMREYRGIGSALDDFVAAVVGDGQPSAALSRVAPAVDDIHLVNAAYRTGTRAGRADVLRQIAGHRELVASFDAMDQHLGRNGFDVHRTPLLCSGWRSVESGGRFAGEDPGNRLLERSYRSPFVPGRDHA